MLSRFRNTALAAVAAALFLGGAGQARADILYSVSALGFGGAHAAFSWEAPTFITPPTSGSVDITGLVSCTVAGQPCANTPTLTFLPGTPPVPDTIEALVVAGGFGFGGFFLPSDFGAVGAYTDVFTPSSATLTVSTASVIPEPSTWAMMLIGFAGLGYAGFRRSMQKPPPNSGHPTHAYRPPSAAQLDHAAF
jgi:hypothetical protein